MTKATKTSRWLTTFQASLQRDIASVEALGRDLIEIDIKRRAKDRQIAIRYSRNRIRLIEELDELGMSEVEFCRSLGPGHSLSTMQRRLRLVPQENWDRYVRLRRERGDDGAFSLDYAAYLATDKDKNESKTKLRPTPLHSAVETDDPDHLILCGDALAVLRARPDRSVQVAFTSPPFWPARRLFVPDDPRQIGMEPTLEEYLDHLMAIFAEVKRVLRDDGVCWVLLDDAISEPPYTYAKQSYHNNRSRLEVPHQDVITQDTRAYAPFGDWLGIPGHFRRAMQSIGWRWRDKIIWNKGSLGRKESTKNRCRRNFEELYMFTKSASNYWYDQDPLRIPLSGDQPRKDGLLKRYTTPGRHKHGVLRRDGDWNFRVFSNPLGRIRDAVWEIAPSGWHGLHSASTPEELVQNCLLLTCRPGGTVIDPFGGSGTVSAVAKRLGFKSLYIDRHLPFVEEAKQRVAGTSREDAAYGVIANDNQRAQVLG